MLAEVEVQRVLHPPHRVFHLATETHIIVGVPTSFFKSVPCQLQMAGAVFIVGTVQAFSKLGQLWLPGNLVKPALTRISMGKAIGA